MCKHDYRQIKKIGIKKMKWNIENIVINVIKK